MKIGNIKYTKAEALARVGNLRQIGGFKRYVMDEGYEKGSELIEVNTGAGLRFIVAASKGMDIISADFCGTNLTWSAPNGVMHPAFYQPDGLGWLHSYSSGLLTTCGFSNVGSPCEEDGVKFGLHGKAHCTPAHEVCASTEWIDDECYVIVSGIVQEHEMFGMNILLKRKILAKLGSNEIEVEDTVENCGFESVPLMLLYHCNFGFPLLDANTCIELPSSSHQPREEGLEPAPLTWRKPVVGFKEQVYYHTELQTADNIATARLYNPEFPVGFKTVGLELCMNWDTSNLPELIEWYMPGSDTHALGIEPSNCRVQGRAFERERGALVMLEPSEIKHYSLSFAIATN